MGPGSGVSDDGGIADRVGVIECDILPQAAHTCVDVASSSGLLHQGQEATCMKHPLCVVKCVLRPLHMGVYVTTTLLSTLKVTSLSVLIQFTS